QTAREGVRTVYQRHRRDPPSLEPDRTNGTSTPAGEELPRNGKAFHRLDSQPAPKTPALWMTTTARLEFRWALTLTGLLLCGLLAVWVASSIPAVTALAHFLWPEQAVLLSLVSLRTFGPTWPVIFLLVLGAAARVLILGAAVVSFVQRLWRP